MSGEAVVTGQTSGPHITGRQLRAARAYLDWSREEMAKQSGVSRATISNFENGLTKRRPYYRTFQRLEECLERNGIELLNIDDDVISLVL